MKRESSSAVRAAQGQLAPADNNLAKCMQQIRETIVHGRLAPGSRIVESELAERLGVSRTPVRGALHMLQREGYIASTVAGKRKVRLVVTPLTQNDARELYSIVGRLEGLAGQAAATLGGEARKHLVKKLKRYNEELRTLAEAGRGNPNSIFDLDMNFHQAIVDAGSGPRLHALHAAIKPQTERYWRLYASAIVDQLGVSVGEHMLIIQAIGNGDGEAAERALRINWENGAARLRRVIDTLGERGSW
jgi:DNA-binding GntR family transcriptional regulator